MLNLYKASAGAGKTYTLTREYVNLLFEDEQNYRKTLAVTFTNNACDEMKCRILDALYNLSYKKDAAYMDFLKGKGWKEEDIYEKSKQIFRDMLHNYSFFFIETIDSFTQRVIRNFAKDLNLPPKFALELDTDTILDSVVKNLLVNSLGNPELHKLLVEFAFDDLEQNKRTNLKKEIKEASKLLFEEKYQKRNSDNINFEEKMQAVSIFFAEQKKIVENTEREITELARQARALIRRFNLDECSDFKGGSRSSIHVLKKIEKGDFSADVSKIMDIDAVVAKKSPRQQIETLYASGFSTILDKLNEKLTNGIELYNTAKKYLDHRQGILLSQYIQSELDTYCRDENAFFLSFANILLKTIINDSDTPFVYEKIGQRIENIMIDEFQDTSEMQWENFKPILSNLLTADGYGLVIGDVKQSIYRFRNGDWTILHNLQSSREFEVNDRSAEIKTNFRSSRNIIEFNNAFFESYSRFVDGQFNAKYHTNRSTITEIYADCAQNTNKKEGEGCVEICMLNTDKNLGSAEAKQLKLDTIFEKVVELLDNGRNPEDIMFLCYKHKDIADIVAYFESKKTDYPHYQDAFSIMSKKALLVDSAPAVQFITDYLLRMTLSDNYPETAFVDASLVYNYNLLFSQDSADLDAMLDVSSLPKIDVQRNLSIFDTCEQIISGFGLNKEQSQIPYIATFQDVVHSYSQQNNTNISRFLEYWDEIRAKTFLPQNERIGSMRATTVHSSKGLAYPVVIMPDFIKPKQPKDVEALYETGDDRLKLVKLKGDLQKTTLSEKFIDEMYQTEIDTMNSLYVACTRAIEELYVFDACTKLSPEKNALLDYLSASFPDAVSENETFLLRFGKMVPSKKQAAPAQSMNAYEVCASTSELLPERNSWNFNQEMELQEETERMRGLYMHQVLEHVVHASDIEQCVLQYCPPEFTDEAKRNEVKNELLAKCANARVAHWFDESWDSILTEQTIVLPNSAERRPDRLMFKGNKVVVVDYKFTKEEMSGSRENLQEHYKKQVREYMDLLSQMGYEPQGYIWYVDLDEIVEV